MRLRTWMIVLAVFAAVIAAARVLLPVGVRVLAERRLETLTGRDVTIADVDLNVFTRRLDASNVRVHGRDGAPPPLTLERLSTRFHLWPIVRGSWHLDELALVGLDVYLRRTAPDQLNVSDILARIAERPEGERVHAVIESLTVTDGRVRLQDDAVEPQRAWVLGDLALEAHDIVTVGDAADGRASATFVLADAPGTLEIERLGIRPFRARATLTLAGLDLAGLAAYAPFGADVRLAGGRLATQLTLDYDTTGAVRAEGDVSARDLVVARAGQDRPLISVPAIALTARDLVYDAGDVAGGLATLSADRITVLDASAPRARPLDVTALRARWEQPSGAAPDAPGDLTLSAELPQNGRLVADGTAGLLPTTADLAVELESLDVSLAQPWIPAGAEIQPARGRVAGDLDLRYTETDGLVAGGRLRVNGLALAREGQQPAFVRDERIVATVQDLAVRDGRLSLGRVEVTSSPTMTDASVDPAHRVHLPRLHAVVEGGAIPGGPPSWLRLSATLPKGGRLEATGTGSLAPVSLALTVRATDMDVALAAPYVGARSPIRVGGGRLDARLSVGWDGALRAAGRLVARDFALLRRGQSEPFIRHPSLEADVTGLVLRNGRLAVERIAMEGAPSIVDATASPPQRFDVQALSLTAEDITWPGRRPARLTGRASLADGGRSEVTATFHPATLAADVHARFENVDVTRARGYLGPRVPLDVDRGRAGATVTLRHRRPDGVHLDAEGAVHDVDLRLTAGPGLRVKDERIGFSVSDLVLHDGTTSLGAAVVDGTPALGRAEVAPPLARLHAEIADLVWPGGAPAPWSVRAEPKEGGHLTATGTLAPSTWTLAGTLVAEDAALAPFSALLPVDAVAAGRLDARVQGSAGRETPMSFEGGLTLRELSIDSSETAPLRVTRAQLEGATLRDRSFTAERLTLEAPTVPIEREKDGTFPLRAMLTPQPFPAASPGERPARGERPAGAEPASGRDEPEFRFGIREVIVRDGHLRFIDRTTTPAYSEEITQLTATVTGLASADEEPATVALQGIVGVNAALDLRGEVAAFATPFFLDVRGELRDFAVPRTNPYLQRFLDWIARRGELTTEVHYRIVGDQLTATNEVLVERLDLEPTADADRSDRLVGIPLGLAVALLKDAGGDIRVTLPVSGQLGAPEFDFGDAIWRAVRNVLQRAVTAPLRALGSLSRRDGDREQVVIEPVRFAPASSTITPDAAAHLQRVGDVLRASPYVRLALEAVVGDEDLRALRAQEVAAEIQRVQRREQLPDFAAAARRLWRARRPDAPPPEDPDAIVAALAADAPLPTEAGRRLAERRLTETREFLVDAAGIQPDRLLEAPGEARVGGSESGAVAFALRPAAG